MHSRLEQVFAAKKGQKVMNLFITAGFPEKLATVELVKRLEKAGADIIELGMPFSDPLADGPTIQYSSEVAINNGVGIPEVLQMVREIRQFSQIPIVLMGYINPVLFYGVEAFCKEAAKAGVDGLILPDVPPEERALLSEYAKEFGLHIIHLVAPNTSDERMRFVDEHSSGFVYCVSVTGVTGARTGSEIERSVQQFIDRVILNVRKNPVLVGFGIQSHEDAAKIAAKVDGFIVGSALINVIRTHYPSSDWMDKAEQFVSQLKQ